MFIEHCVPRTIPGNEDSVANKTDHRPDFCPSGKTTESVVLLVFSHDLSHQRVTIFKRNYEVEKLKTDSWQNAKQNRKSFLKAESK